MARFRKLPVVIEAFRWTGGPDQIEDPEWIIEAMQKPFEEVGSVFFVASALLVHTLEGVMSASVGDYIIRGVAGEIYPCKPDIFAATYEPVLEP
jgi:hypothetical protein